MPSTNAPIRSTVAAGLALGAMLALPTQPVQASAGDNGDRAAAGPVCVWESAIAAERNDMSRGTCFTYGMHEDTGHFFYNQMGDRKTEYVTIADGYYADLVFDKGGHGQTENVRQARSGSLGKDRTGLSKIYVHKISTARAHKQFKACVFKDKGWWELDRQAHARCFPAGEYPDVSLPQFDAAGWFKHINLYGDHKVILYTGKNFQGSSMTVTRNGKIIPLKPERPNRSTRNGRGSLQDWMERAFPSKIQSIKIVRFGS